MKPSWFQQLACRRRVFGRVGAYVVVLAGAVAVASSTLAASRGSVPQIQSRVGADGVIELSSRRMNKGADVGKRGRPAQVIMPAAGSGSRAAEYEGFIAEAARLYHIPAALIRAVIQIESNFDPRVISPANAHGLMQLLPQTAERMMVTDIFDPRQNILGGTRYLRVLANTFNGDLQLTIAAYNAGEGAVAKYHGVPPYSETQQYVTKVTDAYQRFLDREQ